MSEAVRKRAIYRGRVQGVGFRMTVASIARDRDINGYVKNLPDGAVELVADGDADEVDEFLQAVSLRMERYIQSRQAYAIERTEELASFGIRY